MNSCTNEVEDLQVKVGEKSVEKEHAMQPMEEKENIQAKSNEKKDFLKV